MSKKHFKLEEEIQRWLQPENCISSITFAPQLSLDEGDVYTDKIMVEIVFHDGSGEEVESVVEYAKTADCSNGDLLELNAKFIREMCERIIHKPIKLMIKGE